LASCPIPAQRLIAIAHRNNQRLIRLINDILDLEKIEAGKLVFARAPVSLREVAAEAIESNQAFAQNHDVRVKLDAGGADAIVIGDRDRLMQVVTNLLSNAIKFSPGGATVQVSVAARQDMPRPRHSGRVPGTDVHAVCASGFLGRPQQGWHRPRPRGGEGNR
jgi:signal transduction histidine kinase